MKNNEKNYKYKISVILAVYMVEEFIEEAVESLINQTLDFKKNVQLVMVDDGSTDSSGAICDKYKELYPDNIVVVHTENSGLSSARNVGLRYVEGKYVNFFDPDDILTENTVESVVNFFEANHDATDIVSIPLCYFGDMTGPHHLNDKFSDGTRVIDLRKEYQYVQLSLASSFVKHEVATSMFFEDKLIVAEDAEQILRILLRKPFLGVVHDCEYKYRRRGGSRVTLGSTKKGWYNDYVKLFTLKSMYAARDMYGYIPRFVQNTVMCDLQWRLIEKERPKILNDEEFEEYKQLIATSISLIDDEVVMRQRHITIDTKLALLAEKHGKEKFVTSSIENVFYGFDSNVLHKFSSNTLQLSFLEFDSDKILLTIRQVVFATDDAKECYIVSGEKKIAAKEIRRSTHIKFIGYPISYHLICRFEIPIDTFTSKETRIGFYTVVNGVSVMSENITVGRFFPISLKYESSYYYRDGLMFCARENELIIRKAKKGEARRQERHLRRELWHSNKLGERKAIIARALARIYKFFHKKPIWIISDRLNKAGDNGEALFRHLKSTKMKKVDYYYAITKCPDYESLKPLGNVIDRGTLKYKILHLAADFVISSHADDFVINPFSNYNAAYKDMLGPKKFVFLQHGVTKDDISGWLNKFSKNICGFVVAAYPEEKSMFEYDYFYSPENVWLTGFARFDRLYHDEKKYITLMPTWRSYLMDGYDVKTGVWNISHNFKYSEYFRFYNSLINDERLLSACESHGYTLAFLPHPNIIPHISVFDKDPRVKFFSLSDEYKDVYAQSNLVLTDYSSAVFDFAYMRKPVVYAQFDKDSFFAGEHVYTKGYFDYERDGFGEVAYNYEQTVKTLISYIENDCALTEEYKKRTDSFFAFNDKNNCQRIIDRILKA